MRYALEFLDPSGLRDGSTEPGQDVHMIRNAANCKCRAVEILGCATQVGKSGLPYLGVAKEGEAILGREDQMDVHSGQRLWHESHLTWLIDRVVMQDSF